MTCNLLMGTLIPTLSLASHYITGSVFYVAAIVSQDWFRAEKSVVAASVAITVIRLEKSERPWEPRAAEHVARQRHCGSSGVSDTRSTGRDERRDNRIGYSGCWSYCLACKDRYYLTRTLPYGEGVLPLRPLVGPMCSPELTPRLLKPFGVFSKLQEWAPMFLS